MRYEGYIYRHWIINDEGKEKSYVGITIETPSKRWGRNGYRYLQTNTKFANAIKKYGWDNFHHDIIGVVVADTKEQLKLDLNEWEIYCIDKYDSFYNGYNSTKGGDGEVGYKHTEEAKKKMSEARKGKYGGELHPMYGMNGELSPNYGKKHTEETKQKISEALKGKYCGEKASAYGRCGELSPMYGRCGELNPFYGKQHTDEAKQKMKDSHKRRRESGKYNIYSSKKVRCLNTGQIFKNKKEASEWCGLKSYDKIGACCRGERMHAGRHPETSEQLKWEFYRE